MANYSIIKERNIVKFCDENNSFYALDINSGAFIGKSGKPIKTCPIVSVIHNPLFQLNTNLSFVLRGMFRHCKGDTSLYKSEKWLTLLAISEKLDGMNIRNLEFNSLDTYAFIASNFDLFVKYHNKYPITDETGGYEVHRDFRSFVKMQDITKLVPNFYDIASIEMWRSVTDNGGRSYTKEEWEVILYYLVKQKVWEYDQTACKVLEYIDYCKAMEKPFNKQANFMREYIETKKTYNLYKTEYDNNRLRHSYEKHKNAFEFSFGDYVVVLPTCAKDIIDEGKNMHHCVGGYADRVIRGEDYIVFVRHKDTPNECYITCEVYTNGQIGQYFLAYDNYIHSQTDFDFRNAFETHLKENW
jgi:hypothetical protein